MFVAYYVWNVTENVCISRTDDYAIILYVLVTLAFLELRHIFIWSCLKTLLTVAWFRKVLEGVFIEESHIFEKHHELWLTHVMLTFRLTQNEIRNFWKFQQISKWKLNFLCWNFGLKGARVKNKYLSSLKPSKTDNLTLICSFIFIYGK